MLGWRMIADVRPARQRQAAEQCRSHRAHIVCRGGEQARERWIGTKRIEHTATDRSGNRRGSVILGAARVPPARHRLRLIHARPNQRSCHVYRMNDSSSSQHAREPCLKMSAVRTYRQIAKVLTEREGAPISPSRVRRMCLAAERKLARALLADPVFHE